MPLAMGYTKQNQTPNKKHSQCALSPHFPKSLTTMGYPNSVFSIPTLELYTL